ncbi:hypothetical protein EYF80_006539 [Liparis tanakae]|uniref:Uncharacterized protein n=1 Tax=Liparis tanakae TaxID=230148 RepID=A0A4Z2IZ92_9TELE|nr:hypothetical protein EYF80_006539 [Liparis tanakae]
MVSPAKPCARGGGGSRVQNRSSPSAVATEGSGLSLLRIVHPVHALVTTAGGGCEMTARAEHLLVRCSNNEGSLQIHNVSHAHRKRSASKQSVDINMAR